MHPRSGCEASQVGLSCIAGRTAKHRRSSCHASQVGLRSIAGRVVMRRKCDCEASQLGSSCMQVGLRGIAGRVVMHRRSGRHASQVGCRASHVGLRDIAGRRSTIQGRPSVSSRNLPDVRKAVLARGSASASTGNACGMWRKTWSSVRTPAAAARRATRRASSTRISRAPAMISIGGKPAKSACTGRSPDCARVGPRARYAAHARVAAACDHRVAKRVAPVALPLASEVGPRRVQDQRARKRRPVAPQAMRHGQRDVAARRVARDGDAAGRVSLVKQPAKRRRAVVDPGREGMIRLLSVRDGEDPATRVAGETPDGRPVRPGRPFDEAAAVEIENDAFGRAIRDAAARSIPARRRPVHAPKPIRPGAIDLCRLDCDERRNRESARWRARTRPRRDAGARHPRARASGHGAFPGEAPGRCGSARGPATASRRDARSRPRACGGEYASPGAIPVE